MFRLLWERWLPLWAKQTLLKDNRRLRREIMALRRELQLEKAFQKGVRLALRHRDLE